MGQMLTQKTTLRPAQRTNPALMMRCWQAEQTVFFCSDGALVEPEPSPRDASLVLGEGGAPQIPASEMSAFHKLSPQAPAPRW